MLLLGSAEWCFGEGVSASISCLSSPHNKVLPYFSSGRLVTWVSFVASDTLFFDLFSWVMFKDHFVCYIIWSSVGEIQVAKAYRFNSLVMYWVPTVYWCWFKLLGFKDEYGTALILKASIFNWLEKSSRYECIYYSVLIVLTYMA